MVLEKLIDGALCLSLVCVLGSKICSRFEFGKEGMKEEEKEYLGWQKGVGIEGADCYRYQY